MMLGFLAVMITTDNILIQVDSLGVLTSMSFPTISWEEWKG